MLLVLLAGLDLGGFRQGDLQPLPFLLSWFGTSATGWARLVLGYGAVLLGVLSLLLNVFGVSNIDDRRKLKVMLWGIVAGVTPAVLIGVANDVLRFQEPFWLNFAKVISGMNNVDVAPCAASELPGSPVGAFTTASPGCWVVRPVPRTAFYFIRSAMTGCIASVSTYRNRVSF